MTEDDNNPETPLVDWEMFARTRAELGQNFVRILGYFREDGIKSVTAIETAMRDKNTHALVLPAHTLKTEAFQFGADPLGNAAEEIEFAARRCIESHRFCDELVADVVELRRLFEATSALMEREMNPLMQRRGVNAAKPGANQSFGRL